MKKSEKKKPEKKISKEQQEKIEVYLEEGKMYFLTQNYPEAKTAFLQVLKFYADHEDALYHLGLLHEAMNQYAEAKKYFERLLTIQPNHKEAFEHLERVTEI